MRKAASGKASIWTKNKVQGVPHKNVPSLDNFKTLLILVIFLFTAYFSCSQFFVGHPVYLTRDADPAVLAEDDCSPPDDVPDLWVLDHQGEEGFNDASSVNSLPAAVPDNVLQLVLIADLALQSAVIIRPRTTNGKSTVISTCFNQE